MADGLLIYSPKARSFDMAMLPKLESALGRVVSRDIADFSNDKDILECARSGHSEWIAVAGGDGTVERVAAAILGTSIPLGIIPTGTFNNFARSLNLPIDPLEACKVVVEGNVQPTDVGLANGRPFFECLGSGLDAALYPLTEEIKEGRIGRLSDLMRRAYRFRRQKFQLSLDRPACEALTHVSTNESRHLSRALVQNRKSSINLSALMVVVSNGPYFGMNFAIAPHERMDDGLLTVSVFSRYSKLQLWWHFAAIAFGRGEYRPKSIAFRVAKLQLDGPRPLPVHLDGTPQKKLWPVEIECRQGALRVFRKAAR